MPESKKRKKKSKSTKVGTPSRAQTAHDESLREEHARTVYETKNDRAFAQREVIGDEPTPMGDEAMEKFFDAGRRR